MRRREFTAAPGGAGAVGNADETNGSLMTRSSTRRSLMLSAAAIPLLAGAGTWSIGLGSLMTGPAASQPAAAPGLGTRRRASDARSRRCGVAAVRTRQRGQR